MTTRIHNGKTSRIDTIRIRLQNEHRNPGTYSRQYVSHLRAMIHPDTLRKWQRAWSRAA